MTPLAMPPPLISNATPHSRGNHGLTTYHDTECLGLGQHRSLEFIVSPYGHLLHWAVSVVCSVVQHSPFV